MCQNLADKYMTQLINSKKITYYDEDKKICKTRKFSSLESSTINEVWARLEDILSKKKIKGRYITVGKCCSRHQNQTSFIVEVGPEIQVQTIIDIKESLKGLVEFSAITSRNDNGQQCVDSENFVMIPSVAKIIFFSNKSGSSIRVAASALIPGYRNTSEHYENPLIIISMR